MLFVTSYIVCKKHFKKIKHYSALPILKIGNIPGMRTNIRSSCVCLMNISPAALQ